MSGASRQNINGKLTIKFTVEIIFPLQNNQNQRIKIGVLNQKKCFLINYQNQIQNAITDQLQLKKRFLDQRYYHSQNKYFQLIEISETLNFVDFCSFNGQQTQNIEWPYLNKKISEPPSRELVLFQSKSLAKTNAFYSYFIAQWQISFLVLLEIMEQKLKALNKPGNGIQLISGSSRIVITNINKLNLQLSDSMERKAWTQQEDNILRMIIEVKKIKKWSSIARMMEIEYGIMGRTGKQCRERWHNKLDPNINVDNWSRQQQELLFKYHNQYGNKWAKIAKVLQGRSDNCIKNHFYSTLRKAFRGVNKYITENKKRSELRPFKDNVLTKIILLAEQFFEKKIDASDQQLQKCIQIKNSLVEYVLQSDNFSSQKMEQLIQKIAGLSKNLKIKKPKKKKRVFMDLEESIEQELQISEEKSVKVIPSIEQKPKPPQKNSFRLCDIRLTEVKQEQQPAQDFIPKEFLPHQIFNKSPVLMPAMSTLNFFSQRASNEMLLRQSTNLQGSGQFFIFNLSPFVHNNRPNPEMDQSTGLISNSLNFENLWDSGRFSESQLLISTQAPQAPQATAPAPPAPAQQASVGSNSNVYIPIPKMPNLRFEI